MGEMEATCWNWEPNVEHVCVAHQGPCWLSRMYVDLEEHDSHKHNCWEPQSHSKKERRDYNMPLHSYHAYDLKYTTQDRQLTFILLAPCTNHPY